MKKAALSLFALLLALAIAGCSTGVSQDEYDALKSQYNEVVSQLENSSKTDYSSESPSNHKDNMSNSNAPQTADDVLKSINVRAEKVTDGSVCAFIRNDSQTVIDELDIQVQFLDESGTIIDVGEDGHDMILPGYTVVSCISAPDDYSDFKTEVSIELDVHSRYQNHSDAVEISSNLGEDGVIVQITNNDEVTIDEIEFIVVFYLGNKIVDVGFPQDVRRVEPGKTVVKKTSVPYKTEYDRFEVYLNQAHTFGF